MNAVEESKLFVCGACGTPHLTAFRAGFCCKPSLDAKLSGPFPGYSCGACKRLFYYRDEPFPGQQELVERRQMCAREAELCCTLEERVVYETENNP